MMSLDLFSINFYIKRYFKLSNKVNNLKSNFRIESAEGELSICAGDYLLVWGPPDPNGTMLDAELLDGRRGLVPANFVQRLVGDDLLEFHQVKNKNIYFSF